MREKVGEFTSERQAQEDENGPNDQDEAKPEEKTQHMLALGGEANGDGPLNFFSRSTKRRAKNFQIGFEPEKNLMARLPQKMQACEHDEDADERERTAHVQAPRLAVRAMSSVISR